MENYTAESIKVLKGLDGVRKRPSMYVGSTTVEGLHHLIYEIVDNAIDESMAGFCDRINVFLNEDNSVTISDNGRGIPVEIHPVEKIPAITLVLTTLHSGGKFDNKNYRVSGGLHGVGISVVNALSEILIVQVKRNGRIYEQEFSKGIPTTKLNVLGITQKSGTSITFIPDKDIFETVTFNYETISKRLKELAFLNKGLTITITDRLNNKHDTYYYKDGLLSFIDFLSRSKTNIINKPIYFKIEQNEIKVELIITYVNNYSSTILTFANSINTIEGGVHLSAFKTVLTKVINNYIKKNNLVKNDITLSGDDVREGLVAIVSVNLPSPQFEGQTKTKLVNSDVNNLIQTKLYEKLIEFLEEHPQIAKVIIDKSLKSYQAREAARKAKDLIRRKTPFESKGLPGKLADCREKDPSKSELFLVEGDSAGGSAKQARNRVSQAILPLKGKILNIEKSNPSKIFSSDEIKNIITAIGAGVLEHFKLDDVRYHKIIIMTDADIDGSHIQTLLLTLFFRYFPDLIENGYIYIAQPPLYRVNIGSKNYYIKDEKFMKEFLINRGVENIKISVNGDFLKSKSLKDIVNKLLIYENIIEKLKKHYSSDELIRCFALLNINFDEFHNNNNILDKINSCLSRNADFILHGVKIKNNTLVFLYMSDNEEKEVFINKELFDSREFKLLVKYTPTHNSLGLPPYRLFVNNDVNEFKTIKAMINFIEERAKKSITIQRYKGLGEMNPEQLWETTMNPLSRNLLRVSINDAQTADETFNMLMGSKVDLRRKFIEENAQFVKNLDI